jgi:hypothetical protein
VIRQVTFFRIIVLFDRWPLSFRLKFNDAGELTRQQTQHFRARAMREFSAKTVRYHEAEVRIDPRLFVTATVFVGINVWAVGRDRCAKDLNDSPWSKTVEIKRKLGLEAPAGAPKLAGAPGVNEENEREEEDDDDRGGERRGKRTTRNFGSVGCRPELFVRPGFGARYCRERSLKRMQTNICLLPALDYELALVGVDMSPAQKMYESSLQKKTYLSQEVQAKRQ